MENMIELYAVVILLGVGLQYGFYKLTKYAFWCNQLWIAITLMFIYILDSAAIPFLLALIYFGYTLILLNVIGLLFFQKQEFKINNNLE